MPEANEQSDHLHPVAPASRTINVRITGDMSRFTRAADRAAEAERQLRAAVTEAEAALRTLRLELAPAE